MSEKFRQQFADAKGILIEGTSRTGLFAEGAGAPTNGQAGYSPGCLYINRSGTAGSVLYTNTGSSTSTTWLNIA